MFWKKWTRRAKENEILALGLAEKLASVLTKKLNGILNDPPCYTVTAKRGSSQGGNFVTFRIKRINIPGRSDFNVNFVLLATPDPIRHIRHIFEIEKHESSKLKAEEYRKLEAVLLDFFDGWQILEWECDGSNYYTPDICGRKVEIHF